MDKDREWRLNNKEHIKLYMQGYREKHRKILNLKAKLFMRIYRQKKGKAHRKWLRKNKPWAIWHLRTKSRCTSPSSRYNKNGVLYQLSLEQMKSLWLRDKAYLLKEPSIDRINTTGNYTFDNCRFIELSVNNKRVKGKYTLE